MFKRLVNLFRKSTPTQVVKNYPMPVVEPVTYQRSYSPMHGRRTGKHRLARMSFSARVWRYRKEIAAKTKIDRWNQPNIEGARVRCRVMKLARGY